MAGFEVTLYGRIWVTPKDIEHARHFCSRGRTIEGMQRSAPEFIQQLK